MHSAPDFVSRPRSAVVIRPVWLSDMEGLRCACWPTRPADSVLRHLLRAQRIAAQRYGMGVVALLDGAVVGFGQYTQWPRCGEISDLIVTERWRGQGIGTALIERLLDVARELRSPCVEIGAALDNPRALALYRRLGFRDDRTVRLHLDGRLVAVVYLRLSLDG